MVGCSYAFRGPTESAHVRCPSRKPRHGDCLAGLGHLFVSDVEVRAFGGSLGNPCHCFRRNGNEYQDGTWYGGRWTSDGGNRTRTDSSHDDPGLDVDDLGSDVVALKITDM